MADKQSTNIENALMSYLGMSIEELREVIEDVSAEDDALEEESTLPLGNDYSISDKLHHVVNGLLDSIVSKHMVIDNAAELKTFIEVAILLKQLDA